MQHRGEHTRNGRPDKARTRRVSAAAPHLFFFLFLSASALLPQEDAAAQHRKVSAAFYNVENLFDTISSPFRNDSDFTLPAAIAGTRNATGRNFPASHGR